MPLCSALQCGVLLKQTLGGEQGFGGGIYAGPAPLNIKLLTLDSLTDFLRGSVQVCSTEV